MEKIDTRKLTPGGRHQLRQLVVRLRQQSGMSAEDLAKVAGAHVSTVKGWLARAKREDANWNRGYAPKGQTPVLAVPARWVKRSMISAISPRGEVAFRIVDGAINTDRFIEFLAALIEGAPRKIILVVDHRRVHHAKAVAEWLGDKKDRIELVFLPPYHPRPTPTNT